MTESANTLQVRKVTTAHRIAVCAQRLTDERGFDGFTMEDLADAAGVSRRTLFNYFPGKLDAVLGPGLTVEPEVLERFRNGGPHGDLVDDLCEIVRHIVSIKEFTTDEAVVARRIIKADPRLLGAVHQRFEEIAEEFSGLILEREGEDFGRRRATLLVTVMACLNDVALRDVLDDSTSSVEFGDAYVDTVRTLRGLFA